MQSSSSCYGGRGGKAGKAGKSSGSAAWLPPRLGGGRSTGRGTGTTCPPPPNAGAAAGRGGGRIAPPAANSSNDGGVRICSTGRCGRAGGGRLPCSLVAMPFMRPSEDVSSCTASWFSTSKVSSFSGLGGTILPPRNENLGSSSLLPFRW